MKLIKAHINSFGKLQDIDFDFNSSVNCILQPNGYGKTTLTMFLKAMFYGMAKKGNLKPYASPRSKYSSWNGGLYGGSLTFEIEDKKYTIIRTFGATPEGDTFELIDETTGLRSNLFSKDIGQEIFGVGVETFEISAFFAQNGLPADVNDETRANLSGVNKFENDLTSVTLAQKAIASQISALKASCPKISEIDGAQQSIYDLQASQNYKIQQLNELREQIKDLQNTADMLSKTQEEVKLQYKESLAKKEKMLSLTQNIEQNKHSLKQLNQQKIDLLSEAKEQVQNSQKRGKTNGVKVYFSISCVSFMVAMAFILAGIFTSKNVLWFILGAVAAIICIAMFALSIFKKINQTQTDSQSQAQSIEFKLSLAQLDKNIEDIKAQIEIFEKQLAEINVENTENKLEEEMTKYYSVDKELGLSKLQASSLQGVIEAGDQQLQNLKENLIIMKEKREETLSKIKLYEKTKEILLQAKENVSTRYLQPMQNNFEQFFNQFNLSEKLLLDINLNVNTMSPNGLKESEYLSQGYQDLLYICKRFALIEPIFTKEKPFLILDDPFVNLDDAKLATAKLIVNQLSSKYQIIYLCAHTRCKI